MPKEFQKTCVELHFHLHFSATQQQHEKKFHGINALYGINAL